MDNRCCLDAIARLEVALCVSNMATRQRAYHNGQPTGQQRWVLHDREKLRELAKQAVTDTDGDDEYISICADRAGSKNPFLAFRSAMSLEAIERLTELIWTTP